MKKLIALISILLLCSCSSKSVTAADVESEFIRRRCMEVVILDGCEYWYGTAGSAGKILAHKGNCRFCAEREK